MCRLERPLAVEPKASIRDLLREQMARRRCVLSVDVSERPLSMLLHSPAHFFDVLADRLPTHAKPSGNFSLAQPLIDELLDLYI